MAIPVATTLVEDVTTVQVTEEELRAALLLWGIFDTDDFPPHLWGAWHEINGRLNAEKINHMLGRLAAKELLRPDNTPTSQAKELVCDHFQPSEHRVAFFWKGRSVKGTLILLAWAIPEWTAAPSIPEDGQTLCHIRRDLGDKLNAKVRVDTLRPPLVLVDAPFTDVYLLDEFEVLSEPDRRLLEAIARQEQVGQKREWSIFIDHLHIFVPSAMVEPAEETIQPRLEKLAAYGFLDKGRNFHIRDKGRLAVALALAAAKKQKREES